LRRFLAAPILKTIWFVADIFLSFVMRNSPQKLTELGLEAFKPVQTVNSVVSPRPISKAQIKRQIWRRDKGQCTNCGSTHAVEEDHRWPKAKGGVYTLENMRLLCRSCNRRSAVRHFGADKVATHLGVDQRLVDQDLA
jgi:hypothetical protein